MGLVFVMVLGSLLLFITYGVAYYFTGQGIDDATIYHLEYGLDGAGFLEYSWLIVTTTLLLALVVFYLLWLVLKWRKGRAANKIYGFLLIPSLSISLLLNPASIDIYKLQAGSFSLTFTDQIDPNTSISFNKYYRNPYVKESEGSHKNIVFIYAESLERTYFDETIFPDLIKGLRELESKSTYFTNIQQVAGTGWTVGGMTASQCGIPLFTPSHGNSMSGMDEFLSSAVCFGDLLSEQGYQFNYMGGASLDFAGKGKLYKTHGFTDVLGRDELSPKLEDETYKTGWGLYDDSLFNMVYSRFIELSESGNKFGLFTLTLDTHHPNGHPSKSCKGTEYKDASNPILNAVACSDYLISNFIKKISDSAYADNTIVVLVSDHLAMRNTASEFLQSRERTNLFMIIDPSNDTSREIETVGSTLDIGATLLPLLGYAGDIALGRNLLSSEELKEDRLFIHSSLTSWRGLISEFWGFPQIQDSVEINIDEKLVRIDDRNFKIPILIELDSNLLSTLKFQFNKSQAHKSLIAHRRTLERNSYFLLIDECKNAKAIDKRLGVEGFCLLAGQGKKYSKISKLEKNITYTASELKQLLNL
jgi:phosphoglycerol transferase